MDGLPNGTSLNDLEVLGPVDARKWELPPERFPHKLSVEEWSLPDAPHFVELSFKVAPDEAPSAEPRSTRCSIAWSSATTAIPTPRPPGCSGSTPSGWLASETRRTTYAKTGGSLFEPSEEPALRLPSSPCASRHLWRSASSSGRKALEARK